MTLQSTPEEDRLGYRPPCCDKGAGVECCDNGCAADRELAQMAPLCALGTLPRFGAGVCDPEVRQRPDGEFVLFDDVVKLLAAQGAAK